MSRRKLDNTMSHTTDTRTVELARKAVGNIIVDTIDSLDSYEEDDYENDEEAISVFTEEELVGIKQRAEEPEPEPTPEPQPALKVNNSAVAAINRASAEEQRKPRTPYLFIENHDEEDEYAPIRRYKQKSRERREPERRGPEPREPSQRREPKQRDIEPEYERPELVRREREPSSYRAKREDIDEISDYKEKPRPRKAPKRRPVTSQEDGADPAYVEVAPATIRGVAVGLTLLFLMIMAFLVYRNTILSRDLQEANEQLSAMTTLETRLAQAETSLQARNYELQSVHAELADWRSGYLQFLQPGPGTANGTGDPYIPQIPPNMASLPTTHTVVAGQNLNIIAEIHYGERDHTLALHIAQANGIPAPFELQLGMELIIPLPPA